MSGTKMTHLEAFAKHMVAVQVAFAMYQGTKAVEQRPRSPTRNCSDGRRSCCGPSSPSEEIPGFLQILFANRPAS